MEEQTQIVCPLEDEDATDGEEEGEDASNNAHPVGYLRVLAQSDLEQTDFPINNGETTLGRGSECDVVIAAKALSRKHATILVEGESHFIQDLGSRNKSYRGTVQLRPRTYYELTNDTELVFADIKCCYFIGEPPEDGGGEGDTEQTQAYDYGGGDDDGASASDADEADKSGAAEPKEGDEKDDGEDTNYEPTQAYNFADEDEEDDDEPMECEPTVAYNITGGDDDGSDDDSTASSPLLRPQAEEHRGTEDTTASEGDSEVKSKPEGGKKKVCFAAGTSAGSVEGENDETPADGSHGDEEDNKEETKNEPTEEVAKDDSKDEGVPTLKRKGTSMMDVDLPMEEGDNLDPTVAYDMETDEESEAGEEGKKEEKNEGEAKEEEEEEEVKEKAAGVEPTIPNVIDESAKDKGEEDDDETDAEEEEKEDADKEEDEESGKETQSPKDEAPGDKSEQKKDGEIEQTIPIVSEPEDHSTASKSDKDKEPTLLKLANSRITKTLTAVSLMDCMEQGGGTVLMESYESTCEPTKQEATQTLAVGTVVLESYESTCEETLPLGQENLDDGTSKKDGVESTSDPGDDKGAAPETSDSQTQSISASASDEKENTQDDTSVTDELDSVIPGTSSSHSKQTTIFGTASANKRGRGKGRRGRGRGRGRGGRSTAGSRTSSSKTSSDAASLSRETTEQLLELNKEQVGDDSVAPSVARTSTEELLDSQSDTTTGFTRKGILKKGGEGLMGVPKLAVVGSMDSGSTLSEVATIPVSDETSNSGSVPVRGQRSASRGRGRGGKTTRQTSRSKRTSSGTERGSGETTVSEPADVLSEESPDVEIKQTTADTVEVAGGTVVSSHDSNVLDQSEESSVASSSTSTASTSSSQRGRGKRGRGGASKMGKKSVSTPKNSKPAALKSASTPTLRPTRTPTRILSKSPTCSPEEKPHVMFTGVIDKVGQKTVKELGGELVDSVYQCTHLVTDKVRRTVKLLCCLSQGCLIVNDSWLDASAKARRFLPAEPFMVKDKAAERQHKFSLSKSHAAAKCSKVFSGYKVYLTPNVKPEVEQMTDIIKCSGGEVGRFSSPVTPGEGVIIVTCDEDLSMCNESMAAGVPVHSTELILGGVLRQELDLHSHLLTLPSNTATAGRKRRGKEPSLLPAAKRRKK